MKNAERKAVARGRRFLSVPGPGELEGAGRLYMGDDFCERLLPSAADLEKALESARSAGAGFTLLTPYCTEKGLRDLKPLLEVLSSRASGAEVVVNDTGVFSLLKRSFPSLAPVFGRLNTSVFLRPFFSDRRIFANDGKTREFFRRRFRPSGEYLEFLRGSGVRRVEFDNIFALPLLAGYFTEAGMAVTLYTPLTYFTTTRRCLFASRGQFSSKFALLGCGKECLSYRLTLESPNLPRKINVKGNAQFIRAAEGLDGPEECVRWGADRLVEFPD